MLRFAHLLHLLLQLCKTQYKTNWISVQIILKFICLQQDGAICLQYSHHDIIGKPNIHCCWNVIISYNIHVSTIV